MASHAHLSRDMAEFEAAARALAASDDLEALHALEAEFDFVAEPAEAASTAAGPHAARVRDLLDVLTTARSLLHEILRGGRADEALLLADLERRIRDLLERVQTARERVSSERGRPRP